jgi:preprotein translocase subunit SecA
MVSKSVQRAQQKLETRNFSIRKHVLEYDMVMNRQREIVYSRRSYFLNEEQITQEFNEVIEEFVDQLLEEFSSGTMAVNKFDLNSLNDELLESLSIDANIRNDDFKDVESLSKIIKDNMLQIINYKKESIGEIIFNNFIQFVSLKEIDKRWRDHLNAMDLMREGINLRAYGQKNPLIEYKKEGYILFEEMMFSINKEILKVIFRTNLKKVDESKIIIENNMPQNIKLSHNQISGLSLSNQKRAPIQNKIISNIGSNNILNKKYKRNDKITISDGNETKIIKFKKAEDLLNKGWNIVE